jgi:uncharacterized membrane protein YcaP (DUF421 family)
VLVENGSYNRANMRRKSVSEHDIEEDMRLTAKVEEITKIKRARLERSGDLSFITKEDA